MQRGFHDSTSTVDHTDYEAHVKFSVITSNCRTTFKKLERILNRYKSLATSPPTSMGFYKIRPQTFCQERPY